ncbi:glycosyltransferase family 2 protein [Ottowia sp. VDI28]|uniref:glycosyltransferase family 2 protein n=1 Tax=Ottowia sp. VDI28 TaxID=3133968 RepID=UPI003C2C59C3
MSEFSPTPVQLSVILPFYKKLADFRRVLPLNAGYLTRPGVEVVIVMDDPGEEAGLLEFLAGFPGISWRVVVNDQAHEWRPPCVAINVGIRHARGQTVLICSPESAFVTDVPGHALLLGRVQPNTVALGQVAFVHFSVLERGYTLEALHTLGTKNLPGLAVYYGSIVAPRAAFERVQGYDESQAVWGGDDDNVRIRLEMAGYPLQACPDIRLLHLSDVPRPSPEAYDDLHAWERCAPERAEANTADSWGRGFSRVALDAPAQLHGMAPAFAELRGTLHTYRSRRRCDMCGRHIYYEAPKVYCARCNGADLTARQAMPSPRIIALMQVRNESRCLQGCLDHLREHVDGLIALDDGSTDGTPSILRGEPSLIELLSNPASSDHQWRERENQVRLLYAARQHGAEWVLVCDADERYEEMFLKNLRGIAHSLSRWKLPGIGFMFRELWDTPQQFRIDGIWGKKNQVRFFKLPSSTKFASGTDLHGGWCPDEIKYAGQIIQTGYHLYHTGSLRVADRHARRDRYKRLDPDKRFQSMGYDYLAEEGPQARFKQVRPDRAYRWDTLPADLQALLQA